MTVAWLEVHQTIKDHRKTLAAADELEVEPAHMMGMLISFWLWALDNAPDGTLAGITPKTIARAAQWNGDPDIFMEALTAAGWLDETENELEIHDWYEYAGKLIDRRKADAERARRKRAAASSPPPDDGRSSCGRPHDVRTTSADTVQYSTVPNTTEPIKPSNEGKAPEAQTPTAQERRFADFWSEYPKKVGKKAALGSWKRIKPDTELFEKIMQAIRAAKQSEQWRRENGRFIPNPATWLNQGRWDDELEEVNTDGNGVDRQHNGPGDGSFSLSGFKTTDDE
jgi:hypothetical protein